MSDSYNDLIQHCNIRVANHFDLHTKAAMSVNRVPHHHTGLKGYTENKDQNILTWLYKSQNDLCDFLWTLANNMCPVTISRVLDLGCGVGGTISRIQSQTKDRNVEFAGITISPKEQWYASQHLPDTVILSGDMLIDPRLPYKWFNLLLSIESTEYIGATNMSPLLKRADSLLTHDGVFITAAKVTSNAQHPSVKRINNHDISLLSSQETYTTANINTNLRLIGKIDISKTVCEHWLSRYQLSLHNSKDGWYENIMYQAYSQSILRYMVFIWHRE